MTLNPDDDRLYRVTGIPLC